MGSLQITQQTTTTLTVRQETLIQQTVPAPVEPPHQLAKDILEVKPAQPDGPVGVTKKILGGALIGGSALAVVSSATSSMAADALQAPSVPAIVLGASLGAGIGLLNLDTGDKNINTMKNAAAGALIAGSTTASLVAVLKTMSNDVGMISPNMSTAGIGAAFGAGIALTHNEFEDKNLNNAKNVVAGALIGGAGLTSAMSVARYMADFTITSAGLPSAVVGATLGSGIALANMEASTKGGKLAKNLAAGALIGGSVGAAGSAVIRAMATESFRNPSLIGVGVGIAAGVGIALLKAED